VVTSLILPSIYIPSKNGIVRQLRVVEENPCYKKQCHQKDDMHQGVGDSGVAPRLFIFVIISSHRLLFAQ